MTITEVPFDSEDDVQFSGFVAIGTSGGEMYAGAGDSKEVALRDLDNSAENEGAGAVQRSSIRVFEIRP